jgi:hypothetical protein
VIDPKIVLKLDDPKAGYNINVEAFYRNNIACQNAHPDFSGNINGGQLGLDQDNLPLCFFSLPVITDSTCPCRSVAFEGSSFPSNLGFSEQFCDENF